MARQEDVFDNKRASDYDVRIHKVIPGYQALHDTALDILADSLPKDARLLIAGAGTGKETIQFAQARPDWRITAADPSAPMLDTLRARVRQEGLESSVTVHTAYVKDLPPTEKDFDGATSLLISHFIPDQDERIAYFKSIADRLKPGAAFVFADCHGDKASPLYQRLYSAWKTRYRRSGATPQEIEAQFARMDKDVAIIPEARLMELVRAAGFGAPAHFWRGLMFGAWSALKESK